MRNIVLPDSVSSKRIEELRQEERLAERKRILNFKSRFKDSRFKETERKID